MNERQAYEAPKLSVHGTFEALTQATVAGTQLDGNYNQGTPVPGPILEFPSVS